MWKYFRVLGVAAVLVLTPPAIYGCATISPVEQVDAETANARLVVLEVSYQHLLLYVSVLIDNGVINQNNKDQVLQYLDTARSALEAARLAVAQDYSTSTASIDAATKALQALVAYLESQQKGRTA